MEDNNNKEMKVYSKFQTESEEKAIVAYVYKNRSAFLKLAQYLKTDHWERNSYFNDNKLQFIINTCCKFNSLYKKPLTSQTFYIFVDKAIKDNYLKEQIKKTFKEIEDYDLSQVPADYIMDLASSFIKRERAIVATYANQADIENGKYDNLSKRMQDAVTINFDKDLGLSIKDVSKTLSVIKDVKDDSRGCTYGSEKLDRILGQLMPGELAVFCGVPGAGKTAWLGHLAKHNMIDKHKNVIIFSFEVNEQRLSTRLYKALFMKDTNEILNMDEVEASKAFEGEEGDIRIVSRGANKVSCDDMAAILNDLKTYEGFEPDLIEIDYILITSTNDKKADSTNTYKYYKTVAEEMRNLGRDFNCPVVSCAQINREGMGEKGGSKKIITSKDLSESRGILDTVDYLLTINQTAEEKALEKDSNGRLSKGRYRIYIDKNRNGDNGIQVPFIINWKTMDITEEKKIN